LTVTKKSARPSLEQRIENIIHDKFAHMLADVDWRIQQAYSVAERAGGGGRGNGQIYAEDLNLTGRHMLTGYTTTNNSPTAGSIAWANVHMVYQGTDTIITDGNTANAYVWWDPATPAVLASNNTKPVLTVGQVLLFQNVGGTAKVLLSDTNASMPNVIATGSIIGTDINGKQINTAQLVNNAVDSNILNNGAVIAGKIANSAINSPSLFTGTPVDSTVLATGAVVAGKIANSAINSPSLFTGTPVDSTVLANNAVVAGKVASGAINNSNQFGSGVVDTAAIKDGAVGALEIASSAVTTPKLNIMRHILY
jgi:hypothetical protein